jgi:hypothetical protein
MGTKDKKVRRDKKVKQGHKALLVQQDPLDLLGLLDLKETLGHKALPVQQDLPDQQVQRGKRVFKVLSGLLQMGFLLRRAQTRAINISTQTMGRFTSGMVPLGVLLVIL